MRRREAATPESPDRTPDRTEIRGFYPEGCRPGGKSFGGAGFEASLPADPLNPAPVPTVEGPGRYRPYA
jgi:hypothetical protein